MTSDAALTANLGAKPWLGPKGATIVIHFKPRSTLQTLRPQPPDSDPGKLRGWIRESVKGLTHSSTFPARSNLSEPRTTQRLAGATSWHRQAGRATCKPTRHKQALQKSLPLCCRCCNRRLWNYAGCPPQVGRRRRTSRITGGGCMALLSMNPA